MRELVEKRGQVWVETVIYTLIGLTIIGLVLAAALPKINEKKDAIAIEQSINVLRAIDSKIYQTQIAIGNRRVVDLEIRKGALIVDMEKDEILLVLDSSFAYSEIGLPVSLGRLNVTTREAKPFEVELKLDYEIDIRFDNETSGTKMLEAAPTPYKFVIENTGISDDGNIIIDLTVV
ncbi:hypothetical protein KAT36_04555 [Candidatus Pacearchaeota archaeon]|nr:hypothetical protein [Candidatus Pacearchaeota archaeon]